MGVNVAINPYPGLFFPYRLSSKNVLLKPLSIFDREYIIDKVCDLLHYCLVIYFPCLLF